jgi:hypothetical protein
LKKKESDIGSVVTQIALLKSNIFFNVVNQRESTGMELIRIEVFVHIKINSDLYLSSR